MQIDLCQKIGLRLKQFIKDSEYKTQTNFAQALGADPVTIRRWIAHGVNKVSTIEQIARVLKIDIEKIIQG